MRYPWPVAGPGRATRGRPTLQTSSNHHDLNRLTKTPVTNVVNPSPKTTIISEKALRLTTFVTTDQKSTQKTPWIDDVCNNTPPATLQRHSAAGVEGAGGTGGPDCGARGHRGLALSARPPAYLKPLSPLRVSAAPQLKPPSPLRVRDGCFWCSFRVQRCRWFQGFLVGGEQWCWWFQRRRVIAPRARKSSPCVA